jgi:hypothetical protein
MCNLNTQKARRGSALNVQFADDWLRAYQCYLRVKHQLSM